MRAFSGTKISVLFFTLLLAAGALFAAPAREVNANPEHEVMIFDYHRFNTYQDTSMTVKMSVFDFQLQYLKDRGYHFIPLARYVDYRLGKAAPPPPIRWSSPSMTATNRSTRGRFR